MHGLHVDDIHAGPPASEPAAHVHRVHHDDRPDANPPLAFTPDDPIVRADGPISPSHTASDPSILCPTLAGRRVG